MSEHPVLTKVNPPIILCLGGHDPSSGAGIVADAMTVSACGGYPITLITALTAQNTIAVQDFWPVDPKYLLEQAHCLLKDMKPAAIKIGMIGSLDILSTILKILDLLPKNIPLILDPVLSAGGGGKLSSQALSEQIIEKLVLRTQLITPNITEAQLLMNMEGATTESLLEQLSTLPGNWLLKGAHAKTPEIEHHLIQGQSKTTYICDRFPFEFHGSGCTLASAITTFATQHKCIEAAIEKALGFTQKALKTSWCLGQGQRLPNRNRECQ